jgi:hypothetical protein
MLLPSFCPGIEVTYYTYGESCGSNLKVKKRLLFTISAEWAIVLSLSLSLSLSLLRIPCFW